MYCFCLVFTSRDGVHLKDYISKFFNSEGKLILNNLHPLPKYVQGKYNTDAYKKESRIAWGIDKIIVQRNIHNCFYSKTVGYCYEYPKVFKSFFWKVNTHVLNIDLKIFNLISCNLISLSLDDNNNLITQETKENKLKVLTDFYKNIQSDNILINNF